MKITSITAQNFLGARAVELKLSKPVALISGKNGAGKSSLRDAIALALTADLGRVSLKKDAPVLVSDNGETALVEVGFDNMTASVAITAAGKIADSLAGTALHPSLPYILDAQRFAHLDENTRRQFLFGLMGIAMDNDAIKQRLLDKQCNADKVERILPILRAGFDAASKEAAARARDAKASWKTATGGETWGKEKAAKWQPTALPPDADKAGSRRDNAIARYKEADQELATMQQDLGAAKSKHQERAKLEAQRPELTAKAEKIKRLSEKLAVDEEELTKLVADLNAARSRAGLAQPTDPKSPGEYLLRGLASDTDDFLALSCDFPEVAWPPELLNRAAAHVAEYKKLHGWPHKKTDQPDPDAVESIPRLEKGVALMQSAIANDKRDIAEAEKAAALLNTLDVDDAATDLEPLQAKVAELTTTRDGWKADIDKYGAMADQYARRQLLIDKVAGLHADVLEWTTIADALAPDGIPAELLSAALDPINERLQSNATYAEWEPVVIHADMRITYGERDYSLISESEKWRTDAMIAEAVSHQSGLKLLVLDRFDVLDTKGREDLLYWLDGMAEDGDIVTAIVFGTLKAVPAQLLPQIEGFWIENGVAGKMQEAA